MANPTTPDAWMGELFQRISDFMETASSPSIGETKCDCCDDGKSPADTDYVSLSDIQRGLLEDSGILNRLSKSPMREVFFIDTGDASPDEFEKGGTVVDDYFFPISDVQEVEVSFRCDHNGLVDSMIVYPPHTGTDCDCADETSMTDAEHAALTDAQRDDIIATGVSPDECKDGFGSEGRDYHMHMADDGWITFTTPPSDDLKDFWAAITDESKQAPSGLGEDSERHNVQALAMEIAEEVMRATSIHGPLHSPHEGISVIREEVEELWEHVRADTGRCADARTEAIQIAAMGMKYALNLCKTDR